MTTAERRDPLRTCLGCRRVRRQRELWRIVADGRGTLAIDRHAPGRGAWVCAGSAACIERGINRRAVTRALRIDVDDGAVKTLKEGLFVASGANVRDYGAVHEAARGPRHQTTKG